MRFDHGGIRNTLNRGIGYRMSFAFLASRRYRCAGKAIFKASQNACTNRTYLRNLSTLEIAIHTSRQIKAIPPIASILLITGIKASLDFGAARNSLSPARYISNAITAMSRLLSTTARRTKITTLALTISGL